MTFTPRPEDLEEPEMSPELKAIADGVLPGNRERVGELIETAARGRRLFDAEMRRIHAILVNPIAARRGQRAIRDFVAAMAPPDPPEPPTKP